MIKSTDTLIFIKIFNQIMENSLNFNLIIITEKSEKHVFQCGHDEKKRTPKKFIPHHNLLQFGLLTD